MKCVILFLCGYYFLGVLGVTKEEILEKLGNRQIQVVAPASGGDTSILNVIKTRYSLKLSYPENFINLTVCPFHSNSDEFRAQHLISVLSDNDADSIVWSFRGGYGSARIIEYLFEIPKPKEEKVLIGFSDITALHLFLSQEWGWKSIHGQIITDLVNDNKSNDSLSQLVDILTGNTSEYSMLNLQLLNDIKVGKIEGKLTGGNLCLLENSLGTKWQIQSDSKILFTEDVNVPGYQVDRMLSHLNQSGILDNVKAVIFGHFLGGDNLVDFALKRFADALKVPVFVADQFGHGVENFPLVYNAEGVINCEDGCKMTIHL